MGVWTRRLTLLGLGGFGLSIGLKWWSAGYDTLFDWAASALTGPLAGAGLTVLGAATGAGVLSGVERLMRKPLANERESIRPIGATSRTETLRVVRARIEARVAAGGHGVPVDKIRSRYDRLWPLVASAVPLCHRAVFYDNSRDDGPVEVDSFRSGLADFTHRWPSWVPEVITAL